MFKFLILSVVKLSVVVLQVSVYNGTAWEWHDGRKQFYLHQFKKEQPDLNFWNPAVLEFFNVSLETSTSESV
jgi:hypothetical protein